MVIKALTSFTAGRKVTINGTTYQPGAAIPNAVVKTVKCLSALLSSRIIIPNVDRHGRRTRLYKGAPTDISPAERKAL